MTSVIGFMILFCNRCSDSLKCDGWINCPWLSPHDEANCSQQCPLSLYSPIPCNCNKPGIMTCEGFGPVCYSEYSKLLVLFYFCKRYNDQFW